MKGQRAPGALRQNQYAMMKVTRMNDRRKWMMKMMKTKRQRIEIINISRRKNRADNSSVILQRHIKTCSLTSNRDFFHLVLNKNDLYWQSGGMQQYWHNSLTTSHWFSPSSSSSLR